jgi:hypothetical protein
MSAAEKSFRIEVFPARGETIEHNSGGVQCEIAPGGEKRNPGSISKQFSAARETSEQRGISNIAAIATSNIYSSYQNLSLLE